MIEAVRAAITEEMERDERVLVMGEDVGRKGGVFGATDGLYARFGESRVLDTPLAESGIVGIAIGYLTNKLALDAIFQPVYPKKILGIKFHGLFLRRQDEVASSASLFVR